VDSFGPGSSVGGLKRSDVVTGLLLGKRAR
jgi:hypothetical protein